MLLLLAACIDVADDASFVSASTRAGVGLLGSATVELDGGVTLPFTTEVVTDPGMTLFSINAGAAASDGGPPSQRIDFVAEAPGTFGFALHLDGDVASPPEVRGEVGFVSIARLAVDTTGWAQEPALLTLDTIHLEKGADLGSLVFVDDAGAAVSGSASLWTDEDDAGVLDDVVDVAGGLLPVDTRQARTGPSSVSLLDGRVVALPGFVVHELPEGIDEGWSVAAEVSDDASFVLWLTAPDGGPLVGGREYGECATEDGTVLVLATLDGLPTADAGCGVTACLDPDGEEHDLGLCVGAACTPLRTGVSLSFRQDPSDPTCPWQDG